jgi:hypothetical protein
LPAGRTVSDKEKAEIRKDLKSVLKNFSREELLAQWYGFMWGILDEFKNFHEMNKAKNAMFNTSDEELIKMILNRDMMEIVNGLNKGFN